jgi:hypothetical protein
MMKFALFDYNFNGSQLEYSFMNDKTQISRLLEIGVDTKNPLNWCWGIMHDDRLEHYKFSSLEAVRKMQLDATHFAPNFSFVLLNHEKQKFAEKHKFFGPIANVSNLFQMMGEKLFDLHNYSAHCCVSHANTNEYCSLKMTRLMFQLTANFLELDLARA